MLTSIAIFGGFGLMGCLLLWFGVTHPWYAFQREQWDHTPPERRRRIKRGLLLAMAALEAFMLVIGAIFGA